MPLWSHVVGYEEGDAYIHEQLTLGYPRFVYHPSVRELFDYVEDTLGNGEEAMVVFPVCRCRSALPGFCRACARRRARRPAAGGSAAPLAVGRGV